ncbi:MAG: MATE family efflux transporter [Ruminococcaceae bacterium]|nr:MATE family efflux transporter [Oscillospiraceae bacterium]
MASNTRMNMTEGPLFKKLLVYALPVLATGVLQFLYNAADTVVVGQFAEDGEKALAAVGSTGSITALITGLFIGLGVGANVSISHAFGSKREDSVKDIVHTSVLLSFVLGIVIALFGFFSARSLLQLMEVPETVLDGATLYMRTIFLGMPAQMTYNYGAAILNARGDTKHPFYFLMFSGAVNVSLNLFFVIVCKMDVLGVAVATIISQYISAVLILRLLTRFDDCCKLYLNHLYIRKDKLIKIIKIGLPAGIQGCLFSVSNVLIQSSINGFGPETMAANTAAANIDGIIYIAMNSFYHAALAFTGQNAGALRFDRIKRVCVLCTSMVAVLGLIIGVVCYLLGPWLLSLFGVEGTVETSETMRVGMLRLTILGVPYFLCGLMEVMSGMLRGLGASLVSATVSLLGSCVLRVVWIYTVFEAYQRIDVLYVSYPATWIITTLAHFTCFLIILKRREREYGVKI